MGGSHIDRYWAKATGDGLSYHPVPYHSLDVVAVMDEIFRQKPFLAKLVADLLCISVDDAVKLCLWLVAFHDIGKYSLRFQAKRPDVVKSIAGVTVDKQRGYEHEEGSLAFWERYGREIIRSIDGDWDSDGWGSLMSLFKAVAGHHGKPVKAPDIHDAGFGDAVRDMMRFVKDCTEILNPAFPPIEEERAIEASWLLVGLVVLADFIGSNERWFRPSESTKALDRQSRKLLSDSKEYWEIAKKRARRAVLEAGFASVPLREPLSITDLFPGIDVPSPLQALVDSIDVRGGPYLCIFEDLPGSGKTEAAVVLTQRSIAGNLADGFFFSLPTQASGDMIYDRIAGKPDDPTKYPCIYRRMYEASHLPPSISLVSSNRKYNKSYQSSIEGRRTRSVSDDSSFCASWLSTATMRSVSADVGIGPVDQLILAVLPNKFQSLRVAGLARKVIILDEIHGYDPYMTEELCGLLQFLGMLRCSVIIMSATLHRSSRQKFLDAYRTGAGWKGKVKATSNGYPLVTIMQDGNLLEELSSQFRYGTGQPYPVVLESDRNVVVKHLVESAKIGCACWMRNTVDDAREAYEILKNEIKKHPGLKIILIHSRYCTSDRGVIQDDIVNRFGKESAPEDRLGWIVIATQVLQESVDISFDAMVTDLCPIQPLIQRGGRLHRFSKWISMVPKKLLVYGPQPSDEVESNWYSNFFPTAQYVYRIHSKLWLTAKAIVETKCFHLSKDGEARRLINWEYGDSMKAPETLLDRDKSYQPEITKAANKGMAATLKLRDGYDLTPGVWNEERVPTRLDEPGYPVRLAVETEDSVVPWCIEGDDDERWEKSTVELPYRWMDEVSPPAQKHKCQIDKIRSDWPRYAKDIPIIVSDSRDLVQIVGYLKGKSVTCYYSTLLGAWRMK